MMFNFIQMANVGYRSDFELTKKPPYLALTGELLSVFYKYFGVRWPCYKESLLYFILNLDSQLGYGMEDIL